MKFIKLSAFALGIFLAGVTANAQLYSTIGALQTSGGTGDLHVKGINPQLQMNLEATGTDNPDFSLSDDGNTKAQIKYVTSGTNIGLHIAVKDGNTGYTPLVATALALYVKPSGGVNHVVVGGNKVATGYKLSVMGKAIAEEVRVQLQASWPDYVFASDYDLMPLNELEANIKANKHLPGIPAAAEVEASGFDLGEMNRLQMEKIEELTLYIIDLQKQIDALRVK